MKNEGVGRTSPGSNKKNHASMSSRGSSSDSDNSVARIKAAANGGGGFKLALKWRNCGLEAQKTVSKFTASARRVL